MTTQISTKLAALSVALAVNAMMLGTVAYLFDGQLHRAPLSTLAHTAVSAITQVKI